MLADVPLGYRAGGWEVTGRIASGSWASVYAARRVQPPQADGDPPRDACGALKFLPGGALSPPQYADLQEAVAEEVRFNEQVDHPRLIRTFETFVLEDRQQPALHGTVVLAMERAETSLQDVLAGVTPPDPAPDAPRIVAEICEALAHVHSQGWVHGDLKPGNVLLMQDGSVRLADFGLARELNGTHAYAPRLGTSDYLPPEWWTERIGAAGIATRPTADIWALGVTAHQLLTGGMFAFLGATARTRGAAARAYAEGHEELRLADGLSAPWRAIIADCLAPDHSTRLPHTAASLLPRIRALVRHDAPPTTRIPARVRSWWRRGRTRVAAALVVAGAAGGAVALTGEDEPPAGVALRVYNVEKPCQQSMRLTCRLGLAADPHAGYAPSNVTARVRHNDRLVAECFITDGTPVRAEKGAASSRWYRVRTPTVTAWLPGVRAWPGARPAIGRCAD
ncbi:MAG TPA: protein kinase [Solirubrobacteraceae bacterium]|nr:protein kinase [Solirubrobacteraceae bacterium]